MNNLQSEDNDSEPDVAADQSGFDALKAQFSARCKKAGIEYEEEEGPVEEFGPSLLMKLPCGREKRSVYVSDENRLATLLATEFERFCFLGDYEAVYRPDRQTIEAAVRYLISPRTRDSGTFSNLVEERVREGEEIRVVQKQVSVEASVGDTIYRATFGPPSEEFRALAVGPLRRGLTLTLVGAPTERHDQALSFLERFSSSLFFQIETVYGSALALERFRKPIRRSRRAQDQPTNLSFPQHEYDPAPLSLYFYARSATALPLVQFLAYYQVLEFYFPVCYQAEARRRIRGILKDPSFRTDRDTDVTRILTTLAGGGGSGYADERSMLKATLQECIDPGSLRQFLEADAEALAFLKAKTKGLTDHKIPVENQSLDLRSDVAARIYDIRCRIVHTKLSGTDDGFELLLPYSKEARMLSYDIELLQYLARQVLIVNSSPFHYAA